MLVKHRRPNATYIHHPPSAFSLMKWKTNVLVREPLVKWRDVFAFTSVVVQSYSKLIGRCLRLLVNEMYLTLDSLALPVMLGVRDLVQAVRTIQPNRTQLYPCEADMEDMYWQVDKKKCICSIEFSISKVCQTRREKQSDLRFSLHRSPNKSLDRLGSAASDEFPILTVTEVLKFLNWDLFSNTVVAYGRLVLQQGIKGVPIGGHLAGHCAEIWATVSEHGMCASESDVREERQHEWQRKVDALRIPGGPQVVLPGAEPFHCHAELQDKHLLGNILAAKDTPKANVHSVRTEGLHGRWAPSDKLLAWISLHDTDIPVLGITPWDPPPVGRVQHILRHAPRRDKERVQDFQSQFSPHEFVLAELGVCPQPPDLVIPCVMMARFRDNIYLRRLYTHVDFVAKRHDSWRFQHPFFAPKKSISFFRPTPRGFSSWDTTTSPFIALRAAHIHPRFRAWNHSI